MNDWVSTVGPLTFPAALAMRVRWLVVGIRPIVQAAFCTDVRLIGLWAALAVRLSRLQARFAAVVARIEAGRGVRVRPSRAGGEAQPGPRTTAQFPRGKGWVHRACQHPSLVHHFNIYRGGLETMLLLPEAAALVAAHPEVLRYLRPLCHMLGLEVPAVPKIPRKARPRRAAQAPRMTWAERVANVWYPNSEGRPMALLPPRKMPA